MMMGQLQEAHGVLGIRLCWTPAHQGRRCLTDLDTSGDCVSCSDTEEVSIQTAHKKYRRVRGSSKLGKGSIWTEAQLKRINDSHQDVWEHGHESVRSEQKHPLAEDCNSFQMWKMTLRTEQQLHITEATSSKIHTRESEAKTHERVRNMELLLKQYHTHHYWFYEKGMTRVIVGLQRLHFSDVFWCSNVTASVGLKSFCPWWFKFGGNTETIATNLREVHCWKAIACDLCKAFASMLAQIILEHCLGCKVTLHKKKSKAKKQAKAS